MRHTTRYTVVGNHLAQHEKLSLMAIGLAVHIQSLPDGACIAIKALAARFPEGEICVAAALRELEAHGYLDEGAAAQRAAGDAHGLVQPPPPPAAGSGAGTGAGARPGLEPGSAASLLAGLHLHEPRLLFSERDVHRLAPGVAAWLPSDSTQYCRYAPTG
ncbi:hypothetical protein ACF05T_14785 [Streptomyces lateritius]|uniref:Uncharacterized protein n=1 Tax=Streptomyces lateritius TaxID=67313 RepID=A0ABW6YC04_9ACTN